MHKGKVIKKGKIMRYGMEEEKKGENCENGKEERRKHGKQEEKRRENSR